MTVGKAAGWLPPPRIAFDGTLADSAWRRHTQSAMAQLEIVLERDAYERRVNLRAIRPWAEADTLDKLLALITTVQRDFAPLVDNGAGVVMPRQQVVAQGPQFDDVRQR
eukprot:1659254-Prymnesium_polylepis.1